MTLASFYLAMITCTLTELFQKKINVIPHSLYCSERALGLRLQQPTLQVLSNSNSLESRASCRTGRKRPAPSINIELIHMQFFTINGMYLPLFFKEMPDSDGWSDCLRIYLFLTCHYLNLCHLCIRFYCKPGECVKLIKEPDLTRSV